MYKKNRGKKIVTILLSCFLAAEASLFAGSAIKQTIEKNSYAEASDYMFDTNLGGVFTLPVDGSPISIVLGNLSKEDKTSVVNAIHTLDDISTNLNYTILENDDVTIKNKIYINDGEVPENSLGITNISFNNFLGKIEYPVQINIDVDTCRKYLSEDTGNNALATVAMHELGHAHGFRDLYGEEQKNESIMWNELNLETFSESDEERFRKVYGGVEEDTSEKYNQIIENLTDTSSSVQNNKFDNSVLADGSEFCCKIPNKNPQKGFENYNLVYKDAFAEVYEPKYAKIVDFKKDKSKKEEENERQM